MIEGPLPPHQARPSDAEAIAGLARRHVAPGRDWHPFGPVDLELWAGPNLAVASRHPRKGWRVHPAAEARALLLEHAFAVPAGADRAVGHVARQVPLGTPIAKAVAAFRAALPAYRVVDLPELSTTLLVRYPEAVLKLEAGKLRDLEFVQWLRGEAALSMLLSVDAAGSPRPDDSLVVPLDPTDGQVLVRVGLLALACLLAGPVLASPLLMLDAVAWMVGIGLVWTAGIFLAPKLLRAWHGRSPSRSLRIDPYRIWLPSGLGPSAVDRDNLTVGLFWRRAFGATSTQRNPDQTVMHLTAPDLRIALVCEGRPPANLALPAPPADGEARDAARMSRGDFWRVVKALSRERAVS